MAGEIPFAHYNLRKKDIQADTKLRYIIAFAFMSLKTVVIWGGFSRWSKFPVEDGRDRHMLYGETMQSHYFISLDIMVSNSNCQKWLCWNKVALPSEIWVRYLDVDETWHLSFYSREHSSPGWLQHLRFIANFCRKRMKRYTVIYKQWNTYPSSLFTLRKLHSESEVLLEWTD